MIIVNMFVESGCKFADGEYHLYFVGAVDDALDLRDDIEKITDCIENYDEADIEEEVIYTFFLHRANIAAPFPCCDPAFDVWKVLENVGEVNVQL